MNVSWDDEISYTVGQIKVMFQIPNHQPVTQFFIGLLPDVHIWSFHMEKPPLRIQVLEIPHDSYFSALCFGC